MVHLIVSAVSSFHSSSPILGKMCGVGKGPGKGHRDVQTWYEKLNRVRGFRWKKGQLQSRG